MNLSSLEQLLKSSFAPRAAAEEATIAPGRRGGKWASRGNVKATFKPPVRRHSNRLTIEGWLFVVLSLLIGMAAVNSGQNLLYLVFSVMLAMLLVSGILARQNLRKISVQRHYPLEFHSGKEAPCHLEVRNGKRFFSSYGLRFTDFLIPENADRIGEAPQRIAAFVACLRPAHTAQAATRLYLPRRGLYRLVSLQTTSRYPFGFFLRTRRLDVAGQALVFPKLVSMQSLLPHLGFVRGESEANRKGMGSSLFGVRNYLSGDPARLIHWKHSAKGQGLKLKEFEEERAQSFRLMLDLRCAGSPDEAALDRIEQAVSVTATLARFFLQRDSMVSLWTTWGRVPAGYGHTHLVRILRALARVSPQTWDAEIPMMDNDQPEASTFWIVFQDPDELPAGADRGFRRPPHSRIIDVRMVRFAAELNATTGSELHGN